MKSKEIVKRIEDIEKVLNATDEEFSKMYNIKNNELVVHGKLGAVNSRLAMLKEDLNSKKDPFWELIFIGSRVRNFSI